MNPLPSNIQAEQAYISSCLIGGAKTYGNAPLLPTDFYRGAYRDIVTAIQKTIADTMEEMLERYMVYSLNHFSHKAHSFLEHWSKDGHDTNS